MMMPTWFAVAAIVWIMACILGAVAVLYLAHHIRL